MEQFNWKPNEPEEIAAMINQQVSKGDRAADVIQPIRTLKIGDYTVYEVAITLTKRYQVAKELKQ